MTTSKFIGRPVRDAVIVGAAAAATVALAAPADVLGHAGTPGLGYKQIAGSQFVGSLSNVKASIPSDVKTDNTIGFKSANAPVMYVDWDVGEPNGTITTKAQVCRMPWSGSGAVCGTVATRNNVDGDAPQDMQISTAGVHGIGNAVWDYYNVNVWSSTGHTMVGRLLGVSASLHAWS